MAKIAFLFAQERTESKLGNLAIYAAEGAVNTMPGLSDWFFDMVANEKTASIQLGAPPNGEGYGLTNAGAEVKLQKSYSVDILNVPSIAAGWNLWRAGEDVVGDLATNTMAATRDFFQKGPLETM